ncbi:MBL fold metallo-hydrolase, partial [bacterium]|nr:MBL fold metallo-hydrolase [bacterium]
GKSQNTVLIVGFMASNTLGRKLLEKWPRVKIFGEEYNVRAEIVVIDAFSAHADRDGLIGYVRGAQKNVRGVFLVHGEESQGYALAEGLKEAGIDKVKVPHPGESVDL